MMTHNDEVLAHYGLKTAGSINDGSIEDQIDSHLYRLLYLVLAGRTKAPEKGKPYRGKKVGSGLYMFEGTGTNKSDLEVSYHVDVGWGGKKGVAHVSVEVPGKGKSAKKFDLKPSDRIDTFADKLGKALDALAGF